MKPNKELEEYKKIFYSNTEFFSSCNPDVIEEALLNYLNNKDKGELSGLKVNEDKYKIKFTLATKGQSELVSISNFCVRILEVPEEARKADNDAKYCIEFQKLKGDQYHFHSHFNDIVKNALNFSNNAVLASQAAD